jgi:type II secretory pathway pseudopilin PulG
MRIGGNDRGDTLLELLIAVAIMGIAVVAILGAVGSGILMSDVHRQQATSGVAARDYAEAIQTTVADGGYVPCADEVPYASPVGFAAPSGYVKSIVPGSMAYWDGLSWQTTCSTDTGLQRLTVQVRSEDDRASERVAVVLRKPCRVSDGPCD